MLKNEGKFFQISGEDFKKTTDYLKVLEVEESTDSETYNSELSKGFSLLCFIIGSLNTPYK